MVHTCVVAGCSNRRTPGTALSFHRFPRDPGRKERWVAAVNRAGWAPNDGSRLCSSHFISGKQVKNPCSPDYASSVFTPVPFFPDMKEPGALEVADKQEARVEAANALLFLQGQGSAAVDGSRQEERHGKEEAEGSAEISSNEDDEHEQSSERDRKKRKFSHTSELSVDFDDVLKALKKENRALRESVEKMSLSESTFRNDAEKVKFYTGLPNYFVLETVTWLLAPHMDATRTSKLSKFQQLLLTLMRLRLDLRNQDLAYRFGVKVGTVVRTVRRVVAIMAATLVPTAVFWPSRAELRKNLPAALRASHPDCAVIVDCFTVPLEQPSSNQEAMPSCPEGAGPSCASLKYLIGLAPQGVVTFVSRGAAGSVSDRSLAEGCGFLYKLRPGDVVLACRDLDIADSVEARGAAYKIVSNHRGGACSRSEGPPGPEPVSETLTVQRHVERVVSMVKQRYAMLSGPVESAFSSACERTSSLSTFDKIVQVACALNNLCISAAPLE